MVRVGGGGPRGPLSIGAPFDGTYRDGRRPESAPGEVNGPAAVGGRGGGALQGVH